MARSESVGGVLLSSTIANTGLHDVVYFTGTSNGAGAVVMNSSDASIDISKQNTSATIGELDGSGNVFLGSKNLAVGALNTNGSFGGDIQDGGTAGGTGGSFTKVGTGTFSLTGTSTYTGNTEVAAGTLFVDGSTASPLTTVDPGAMLGGIGTIGGNVYNHGTVMGGDAPGTLTIGGNYVSASNGSNLLVEIENVNIFSRLVVNGSATITGALTVQPSAAARRAE